MKPPHGLEEIIAMFGDPRKPDFEAKYIVPFALPYPMVYSGITITKARAHKLIIPNFILALSAISAKGLQFQAKNYGGIYAVRNIRGDDRDISLHAFGIAIDLEPSKYPMGSTARFSDGIVKCFRDAGFFYGGDFKHRPDPMHFEYSDGTY
jgi:hypothetical protein